MTRLHLRILPRARIKMIPA